VNYSDIHLTAANLETLGKWTEGSNRSSTSVFEKLTPGPITVFCEPSSFARDSASSVGLLADENSGKVGFRIPDSSIERDIASTNEHYLIASAPILHSETGAQVVEFHEALSNVQERISRFGQVGWGAIEGRISWTGPVSIVEVEVSGAVSLIREGIVPFDQIEASARIMSSASFEDWG
jgi:tRNA A37 threonylcarbamoyladenosine synthetase subunit TsaC/SUA5/YrdC